jgi:hypothetical protein
VKRRKAGSHSISSTGGTGSERAKKQGRAEDFFDLDTFVLKYKANPQMTCLRKQMSA